MRKQLTVLLLCILAGAPGYSQTAFWSETFDGTACVATSGCDPSLVIWTTTATGTEGAFANKFYVSCQENGNAAGACGSGCGSDQSLHVGNTAGSAGAAFFCPTGDCGASYDATGANEVTSKRAASPTIDCSGKSTITMSYNYIERGQTTFDDATCWYFDGATWTQLENMPKTAVSFACLGQGRWTARSIALPASANNNPLVRIGFRWVNNGDGSGSDPSFAVDDIVLSYLTVLPIELLSFSVNKLDGKNQLVWSTASETGNDYFTLQRSVDGIEFFDIGNVPGSGYSTQTIHYDFYDHYPLNNTSYYRLKQTDFNGDQSLSQMIAVTREGNDFALLNAFYSTDEESIELLVKSDSEGSAALEVVDMLGREIFRTRLDFSAERNKINIAADLLKSQVYLLKLTTDDLVITRKIAVR